MKVTGKHKRNSGLTLIELIVTITIISLTFVLVGSKLGISNFWKEEAFLRKFRETITFLHQQAVVDQSFYRLDFDFQDNSYLVSAISTSQDSEEEDNNQKNRQLVASGIGYLSQELSLILSPAIGRNYQLIPPPSFPSLAKKIPLPTDMSFDVIKTQRGDFTERQQDQAYILFSPRGYTEFAVIHLNQGDFGKITIFINPFTGNTELYREYKEFDWNYSNTDDEKS